MKDFALIIGFNVVDVAVRGLKSIEPGAEMNRADSITLWIGGDAVNESYVLNRLGVPVKLMTGLADDAPGDFIRAVLDKAHLDRTLSPTLEGASTGISVPVVYENAERCFITSRGPASLDFRIDLSALSGAKVVSLASLFLNPLLDKDQVLAAAKQARANGSILCADMMMHDAAGGLERFAEIWPYVDYFFPNSDEAAFLTGEAEPEKAAARLLEAGVKNVIIKIGRRGCLAANKDGMTVVPGFIVTPKDTTGAGDNFAAGFITGLMEDRDLKTCCRFANAAASIAIQYDGASTGIRSRAQLDAVLNG